MAHTGAGSGEGAVGQRTVTEAAVHAFASLTGDYARMHLDHEFGRALAGGRPIAHGLLSACWALGALTRYAPERLLVHDPAAGLAGFSIRLSKSVAIGDTLAVRWSPADEHALELSGQESRLALSTAFEVPNQHGEVTGRGVVTVLRDEQAGRCAVPPQPWAVEAWSRPDPTSVFFAEDLLERGPRGETRGQTLSETDVVSFAREVGELNPRSLNLEFARRAAAGERVASPMLIFCLGFAEFLQELLSVPMPASGFAGHVGDSWRVLRPVRIGDTIQTRHRPLECRRSRSRPDQAIVQFGLQFLNQREEVVQDGRVAMMIPARPGS